MNDVWQLVHTEREKLIVDLADLDEDQWDVPSLCEGWTVRDVAAHLADVAVTTRWNFITGLIRAGFDFDLQNQHGVDRERGASTRALLARLREVAPRTSTPPAPLDTRLVEEIVHGEDIRRPLGLTRAYPPAAVERALRQQTRMPAKFGGAKELTTRVTLAATDTDLRIGEGPDIRGTTLALLLAVMGRPTAPTELDGPGLPHHT